MSPPNTNAKDERCNAVSKPPYRPFLASLLPEAECVHFLDFIFRKERKRGIFLEDRSTIARGRSASAWAHLYWEAPSRHAISRESLSLGTFCCARVREGGSLASLAVRSVARIACVWEGGSLVKTTQELLPGIHGANAKQGP